MRRSDRRFRPKATAGKFARWVGAGVFWLANGLVAAVLGSEPMEPGRSVGVDLTLLTGGSVSGPVIAYTDDCVVVDFRGAPHAVPWSDVETGSAYRSRRALFEDQRGGKDELTAEDHFRLGFFALTRDHVSLARREFQECVRIDESRKADVDAVLRLYADWKADAIPASQAVLPAAESPEAPGAEAPVEALPEKIGLTVLGPAESRRYPPQTPQQRENVIRLYKDFGQTVRARLGNDLVLIESDHFLIWTDWTTVRRGALERWCERMYEALCEQFTCPVEDSVFLGKCPVFCFRSRAGFKKFARLFDQYEAKQSFGYTRTAESGHVHIVVYCNGASSGDFDRFGATLVHEGCHAFLHRYRSNRSLAGWVSEGLANLVVERVLGPSSANGETADVLAWVYWRHALPATSLWSAQDRLPAHLYPLAHSFVDFLIRRDAHAFALMIADIKDGMPVERALGRRYDGLTCDALERAWRQDTAGRHGPSSQPSG